MEATSVKLCREYQDRFGHVLHHNIDKGLLVAGQTTPQLGGGKVVEPMRLIFGDRDTYEYRGVNTLDDPDRGEAGMYLTVLGTSAESGDGGQVGRGNRINGVIAFNPPSTTEAAAGKNPISHVRKSRKRKKRRKTSIVSNDPMVPLSEK
ncbi:MAG: methionine adenosyltransferase [Desulfobacterales bacterium]